MARCTADAGRGARAKVRVDKPDVRPFMFLLVLTAWMLLWTFDAALSAPGEEAARPLGPLAAVGSVAVDGGRICTGVLTGPRQVLTSAHCLWDAEAGRWAPARSVRFLAGHEDGQPRGAARTLSYWVSPQYDPAQAGGPGNATHDWVLLELDDGLGGTVAPLPEMSLSKARLIRHWSGQTNAQTL